MSKKHSTASPSKPARSSTSRFVYGPDQVPIAGVGSPLPCPFCGVSPNVQVTVSRPKDGGDNAWAEAHCECCGAQGPFVTQNREVVDRVLIADLVVAAAKEWNKRGRP